ncbi:CbtB-domain containing protein [Nostoc sp. FACHB-152]|uniref:CbtB-domain containing protein n=1 Tax=unclassified Nostoc TaxID=2593658 RepID=UPI00168446CF|nr:MULTISPECIES: CbtB-domain containing protein [unclassified Nostoc]MBD2448377.1 CbtB-domain containing protein [Nostoc sp. FACHB-152]MBD2470816.1 CbtB-domain containing protein [Nostoc sp. FACHB-145]
MTTQAHPSVLKKTASVAISTPVQATLFVSLCALTLWTVYFTTNPAIHDRVHSVRHHTLLVGCH